MTRRYLDVLTPRGLIVPSDFQSMGFGIPAAVGAMLADRRRPVLAIVGDGGFFMAGLELATACRERLPLGVVVFNDGQLNQIRLQQLGNFGHTHAVELARFDYEAFAMAMAMDYRRFDGTSASFDDAWSGERPTLVEVVVGDSHAMRRLQSVARAKGMARRVLGPRIREWLKSRLRGKR